MTRRNAETVFVRTSGFADVPAIADLAELSGKEAGRGRFLLAEVSGRIVAATPLDQGETISDPSVDTQQIEELLTRWAANVRQQAA